MLMELKSDSESDEKEIVIKKLKVFFFKRNGVTFMETSVKTLSNIEDTVEQLA